MNRKGHAVVEFALLTPFFAVLLAGFLVLARVGVLKQRALGQARFGTLLYASGLVDPATIGALLTKPNVVVELDRYRGGAANFYHFVQTVVRVKAPAGFIIEERVVCQGEPES